MYMNLKPNKHKRISFNTMTMASLGFIGPPKLMAMAGAAATEVQPPAPRVFFWNSPLLIYNWGFF